MVRLQTNGNFTNFFNQLLRIPIKPSCESEMFFLLSTSFCCLSWFNAAAVLKVGALAGKRLPFKPTYLQLRFCCNATHGAAFKLILKLQHIS